MGIRHSMMVVLLGLPWLAQGASGAWVADNIGVTQGLRGVPTSSAPLHPVGPNVTPANRIVSVSWRIQFLSAAPSGLLVKLCTPSRCIALDSDSGQSRGLAGESAASPMTFVYLIQGQGRVNPPLQVMSNQVIVNYQ
ncbi:flagellar protein FlhE [Yersinia ruckeri]|uniref:Flagellar biosynthesis protein FlhE n=1 Tax=Yersinia ruckeri TaxID=29486 RepID=C8BKB3_YERRU|nr:flagellar protein FlhE [Yersinia ruckeri]ACT22777.1 flagellar biosynthesis protein FlhE [Yersinia ruckeri]AKA37597.1 flagellar protein flhE [Yersinia ruckeri]ARZ00601.1 flagellar protein FlhE [Yersinia ruckeri]AUQ42727.1 flagellar protein FlhE [Yersinia ruckeri]EKN3362529.1 flagellar protein FlhE [Yersinia ruckeri]